MTEYAIAFFAGAMAGFIITKVIEKVADWFEKRRQPDSNLVCIWHQGNVPFYMESDVYEWASGFPTTQWMQLRGRMLEWYQENPEATACLVYPSVPEHKEFAASIKMVELHNDKGTADDASKTENRD